MGKYRKTPQWVAQRPSALLAWLSAEHYCSRMAAEGDTRSASSRFDPPLSQIKARQMGELVRGDSRWDVLLETVQDAGLGGIRGRVHFISGNAHRLSGWIFLEWSEQEVLQRFSEFSSSGWELWNLLNSLSV